MLRIVRYFKGGVSYDYLDGIPIKKVFDIGKEMNKIYESEKRDLK